MRPAPRDHPIGTPVRRASLKIEKTTASKTLAGESWFPRACLRCAAAWAHRGLFEHAPLCEQCTDEVSRCEIGLALYRLIRQGRRP